MRHRDGKFEGAGGASIYFQQWLPEESPRAIIVVVHGAAEHGGRYARLAGHFVQRGYAVASLDHIGHGRSDGTPGTIGRFADYVDTLDIYCGLLRRDYPEAPLVLLGHSMGGLISSCYLLQHQQRFAGCILSGPAIKTELTPPWWQLTLIRFLSVVWPNLGVLQLDASGVSRDPDEVRKYVEDPLVHSGKLSARMVAQLFAAMAQIQTEAAAISLPIMLLHGSADTLTAPAGSEFLYEQVSSTDKTLKIYPGLYHEIFNEPEHLDVFADIEAWLGARIAGQLGAGDAPGQPESGTEADV